MSKTKAQRFDKLPDVLFVAEVADFLGLSEASVRHHVRHNHIPHARIGSRIVVYREALRDFMVSGTEAAQ